MTRTDMFKELFQLDLGLRITCKIREEVRWDFVPSGKIAAYC